MENNISPAQWQRCHDCDKLSVVLTVATERPVYLCTECLLKDNSLYEYREDGLYRIADGHKVV